MVETKPGKKDLRAELKDLLAQRNVLRNKTVSDADRTAYAELTSRIITIKKKLKLV